MAKNHKNILMVYPRFPDTTYWSFSYALPFIDKKSANIPLGLITIAPMLPKNYNIKLIDLNIEPLLDKDIENVDVVFTSSMIVQKDSHTKLVSRIKEFDIPLVVGGPFPTQYYDCKELEGVDHFIIGEAESGNLEAFIKDFEKGQAKKAYARVALRNKSDEKRFDQKEFENLKNFFGKDSDISIIESRPDMALSPIPRFDLLKIKDYGSMAIQYSRGCPNSCNFCNESALFGHKMRLKPSAKLNKELDELYKLGYRGSVFVVDDNFIGNKAQVKKDLVDIRKFQEDRGYPFMLYTEATINLAKDKELMRLMRDSGFSMVFVGIETLDKKVLESMSKFQNAKTNMLDDVKTIQSYGMEVTGGFIVGNDNDSDDVYDNIFNFCKDAGIPTAMVGLLTALKGAPLHEMLKNEGRLLNDSEGDNTHSFEPNFITVKDKNELVKNYKNLIKRLYKPKNYFQRSSMLLDNLGYNPKGARTIGSTEIKAVQMSLRKQGFRPSYFKFIGHTLIRNTSRLSEAFRLAIMGYHYMKITKSALKADELHEKLTKKYDYINSSIKSKLYEGEDLIHNIQKETNKFLSKVKKRISKLPDDYRPRLIRLHDKICGFMRQS